MDFFNTFRSFFGLNNRPNDGNEREYDRHWHDTRNFGNNSNFKRPDEDDGMGFNIFTNPLEMHRYFEQQMNEFFKQFQFESAMDFGNFSFSEDLQNVPAIEDGNPGPSRSLRDQFLKSGFENRKDNSKVDTDVDKNFRVTDLDDILRQDDNKQKQVVPHFSKPSNIQIFGQSTQFKTITNPDGSVEMHKIVRDNAGNEERTITRKRGDQEHTVMIRRDKDGREEKTENFVNIDETNLNTFWRNDSVPRLDDGSSGSKRWFGWF